MKFTMGNNFETQINRMNYSKIKSYVLWKNLFRYCFIEFYSWMDEIDIYLVKYLFPANLLKTSI